MEREKSKISTANDMNSYFEPLVRRYAQEPLPFRQRFIFTWFAVFFLIFISPVFAQEEIPPEETEEQSVVEESYEEADEPLTPAMRRAEMEIKTSTLSELASWCRTLGLSESGTREALSARLRNHFQLPEPSYEEDKRKTIIIESAQTTEYFSIEVINEDYARLKGNVSISMVDGGDTHKISADEILFNRTRNILTARGKVSYTKTGGDSTETFRGENITIDLDNWSSILLDGGSSRDSDGTAYYFSGAVISHTDENVTFIRNAEITNAANPDALWSINASRLWLLPGSDFAILHAILKVGEIPVLYFPFLYLPGDKLFFHPVFGYRSREGGFVQSTTYILGQPSADPEETISVLKILGNSDDMEREREGLFLRSTGRKRVVEDSRKLKLMLDYYVNLGFYAGVDFSMPKTEILNPIELSFGIAFSRNITYRNGNYTPFKPDGSLDWRSANFFSLKVPFRYRLTFQSSISARYGSIAWNFPFYSDSEVNMDFLNRSENMDFFNIMSNSTPDNTISTSIPSFQWQINGNFNPPIAKLNPYISRLSLSSISTSLTFKSLSDKTFAPDKYIIYNISGSLSGTLFSYGGTSASSGGGVQNTVSDPLAGIGTPISPWSDEEDESEVSSPKEVLSPPVITQNFSLPRAGNNRINISYQITPASSTEQQFYTRNWTAYDKVDWSDIQSVLSSFNTSASLNFNLDHTNGLYSNALVFSGSGTLRNYGYLNENAYASTAAMNEVRRTQYSQTNYSSFYSYSGTLRPFYRDPTFGNISFQYNFRGTLVRSRRWTLDNSPNGPDLTPQWGSWVKEERVNGIDIYGLTAHRLTANFSANIRSYQQTISFSADLPPLDSLLTANASFRFWISDTSINFRIEGPKPSENINEWIVKPITIAETLRFTNYSSFVFNMVIKPEEDNDITNITALFTYRTFRASFSAEKAARYNFNLSTGWQQQGDPVLHPRELLLSYSYSFPKKELIKGRLDLSFNAGTSLSFNLQRYTNSNFQLTLSANLNVPGILEFSLSATSRNSSIWRYFKGIPGFESSTSMYPEGDQNNLFIDLFDSFNFFNETLRRRSAFKIQRMDFKVVHLLGDWTAELGVSMYPYQNVSAQSLRYQIATDFHFIVSWKPISEIKSDINYDGKNNNWAIR